MKRILMGLSALLFWGTAGAADLTQKVQETYRKTDQFRAEFVQETKVEILERTVTERGELIFAKPGKFIIHYKGPRERKFISDGKALWIYRPADREVEIYEKIDDLVSHEALVFLGGLGDMTKEFKVSETEGNRLLLLPKRQRAPFLRLVLTVDPNNFLVTAVEIFPKSGNESRYRFSSIRLNQPVPDTAFRFREEGVRATRPLEL